MKGVKEVTDARKGLHILNGDCVRLYEVHAEEQLEVLLSHHDHGGCQRTVGGANDAALQYLLYLFGFLPPHSRVLLKVGKPHRGPLCLNGVFENRGLPDVFAAVAKVVLVLLQ